jgi:phospholipid N-methyltransferase
LIQEGSAHDSIVALSYSTDFLRRLFQQYRSKAAFSSRPTNVRSTSKSGVEADILEPPLGARKRHMHRK